MITELLHFFPLLSKFQRKYYRKRNIWSQLFLALKWRWRNCILAKSYLMLKMFSFPKSTSSKLKNLISIVQEASFKSLISLSTILFWDWLIFQLIKLQPYLISIGILLMCLPPLEFKYKTPYHNLISFNQISDTH